MTSNNSQPHFELRFRPTAKEYMALLGATKHTWAEKLYAFVIPAGYWGLALLATMPFLFSRTVLKVTTAYLGSFAPVIIVLVLGGLFYLFHTFVLLPRVIRDTLDGQIIGQGENHITIDGSGIVSRVGEIRSEIPWSAVERVADFRGCILLFTGRNSGLILPRRVFFSGQEADRLLAFANQKTGVVQ